MQDLWFNIFLILIAGFVTNALLQPNKEMPWYDYALLAIIWLTVIASMCLFIFYPVEN